MNGAFGLAVAGGYLWEVGTMDAAGGNLGP